MNTEHEEWLRGEEERKTLKSHKQASKEIVAPEIEEEPVRKEEPQAGWADEDMENYNDRS